MEREKESQYKNVTDRIHAIEENIESIRQNLIEEGELWMDAEGASITPNER